MKLAIDIPYEFENHYFTDKFRDSMDRVLCDITSQLDGCSGRYEVETIEMLRNALEESEIL